MRQKKRVVKIIVLIFIIGLFFLTSCQKEYKINYNLGDGTLVESLSYKVGQEIKLPTPTKKGYIFLGWYENDVLIKTLDTNAKRDYTLVAKWEICTYTINYDLDGGELTIEPVKSFNIENVENIQLPTPTKKDYIFAGWYENGQKVSELELKNYNLVAKWTDVYYYIQYETDGGEFTENIKEEYTVFDEFTLPIPVKEGYEFKGWYLDENFEGDTITSITKGSKEDYVLYAKWEKVYKITYVLDGGTLPDEAIQYYHPGIEEVLPTPSKKGYVFMGWNERSNATSGYTRVPISYEEDITINAIWKKRSYSVDYVLPEGLCLDKEHLFRAYFTEFYNYIVNVRDEGGYLSSRGVNNVDDFLKVASTWNGGGAGMADIGNLAGKYYLKIDTGGKIEDQKAEDGFIGYCLEKNKFVEFVYFIQDFFYWWRLDEGYTGGSDDPQGVGSDFLASAWASLVDTAKFFYFEKDTLPHYFITKGHVPEFYDRIPYIISNTDITFTYIYDWEKGMDLVKNIEVNGYEFLGWYDNPDFEGKKIERLEKGIYHNIVLYGKFVKKSS